MSLVEKTLTCADCGDSFAFTVEEQEFYQSKGFTNEPKRCNQCRQTRKSQRSGGSFGGGNYGGGNYGGGQRQMYPAVCATCGKDTQVPFEPRNGRPVYCSDCYSKTSSNRY